MRNDLKEDHAVRQRRRPWLAATAVAAVLAVSVTACGGGKGAAAQRVQDALHGSAPVLDDLVHGGGGSLDDGTRRLRSLRAATPESGDGEIARASRQLDETLRARARVEEITAEVDRTLNVLPTEANAVAQAATPYRDLQREVAGLSESVLRDVLCDVTFSVLTDSERAQAAASPRAVPDLVDPTVTSISNHGYTYLASTLGPRAASAVDWLVYGQDILGKVVEAVDVDGDGFVNDEVTTPYWTMTRAFIYYARACLQPPR